MYGFIYITTNKVNGKKYLGQKKYSKGWENYLGSGILFLRALDSYGRHNFTREIIAEAKDAEELNELEEKYIKEYRCVESDEWYNIRAGGSQTNPFAGYNTEELKRWRDRLTERTKEYYKKPFYVIDITSGKIVEKFDNKINYSEKYGRQFTVNSKVTYNNLVIKHSLNHLLVYEEDYYNSILKDALIQNNYFYIVNAKTMDKKPYFNKQAAAADLNTTIYQVDKSLNESTVIKGHYIIVWARDFSEEKIKNIYRKSLITFEVIKNNCLEIIKKQYKTNKTQTRLVVAVEIETGSVKEFINASECYKSIKPDVTYSRFRKRISEREHNGYVVFTRKYLEGHAKECFEKYTC